MALRQVAKKILPASLVRWIQARRFRTARPPVGWVRFGSLRRTDPISRVYGLDRGTPIDRYYIDRFMDKHRERVRGRMLEVGDDRYTSAYGDGRVTRTDILHAVPGNPRATFIGDLSQGAGLPEASFDGIILTQVMQYVPDPHAAISHLRRCLLPGGSILAILPALIQGDRGEGIQWADRWRFTASSARELFASGFSDDELAIESYGNVLAVASSLMGLAQEDLRPAELDAQDPAYPLVIAVCAMRQA